MQSLHSARSRLNAVLDEYSQACLTLVNPTGSHPSINSLQDLSSYVSAESDAFASIKEKAMRIEATLLKARNCLISVVPINSLPDEVFARIFHLVLKAQSTDFEELVDENSLRIKSLAVSQVCARWRQVSLNCRSLWSHIDLSTRDEVLSLGKCLASRSGDQPLSIRVVEPLKGWTNRDSRRALKVFISNVAQRLESLEMACVLPPPSVVIPSFWFDILQSSISCATRQLNRLVLSVRNNNHVEYYNSSAHWFIDVEDDESEDDEAEPNTTRTGRTVVFQDITRQDYDDILLNVKVLWLDVVYPIWASKAYHGLTELRLIGPPRLTAIITPEELAKILAASPGLRALHLGMEVRLTGTLPAPIRLDDLEVFLLQSLASATHQAILRLILPGRKPLQMGTTYEEMESELPARHEDEFVRFFRRSNIVQLQIHSPTRMPPGSLIQLLPNIQTLIFRDAFIIADDTTFPPPCICPELSALHFISCIMHLDCLLWLVSVKTIREVTIWESKIFEGETDEERPAEDFRHRLMEACPVIHFLDASDYERTIKIEGWGEDIRDRIANAENHNYAVE
ncbi:hypothetical protein RSAG8_06803, partial [Rhizoctonia solani AG-8 WAC10335]